MGLGLGQRLGLGLCLGLEGDFAESFDTLGLRLGLRPRRGLGQGLWL